MGAEPEGTRWRALPAGVLTDGVVVAFALWTIAANSVVIAGGTRTALALAACLVLAMLLGIAALVFMGVRPARAFLADAATALDPITESAPIGLSDAVRWLAMSVLTWALWLTMRNAWLAWAGLSLSALALCFRAYSRPFIQAHFTGVGTSYNKVERAVLYTLALGCALFTLLAVRPRSDDTLYLNLAVSVIDAPKQALLSVLTLHGPPTPTLPQQLMFPPYRVQTFELLGGLIAWLTGVEPAVVVHLGLATLIGWLTPFALARLLRLLAPKYWLLSVLVVVSFYFIEGSASRGYANHALVRYFNGKSALLTLGVPLICAYGLRYAMRPSAFRLALLAMAQIAAVGLSSTAVWLAPTLAAVSIAAATPSVRRLPLRLAASVLSSAYVLGLGIWLLAHMRVGMIEPGEADAAGDVAQALVQSGTPEQFATLVESLGVVLGPGHTVIALLAVALLTALLAPTRVGARLFAALCVLLCLGFANPLLASWVEGYVTGAMTHHRVFWLLPIPVGLGLCLARLWDILRARLAIGPSALIAGSALCAFYAVAVDRLVISEANGAKLEFPPALKLPPHARAVAEQVCKVAPKGKYILAPRAISQQLPIIPNCGYPLIAEDRWLSASQSELKSRSDLVRYVDEPGDVPEERAIWFLDALARYRVDVLVLSKDANKNLRSKSLVWLAGFERVGSVEWEHLYVRTRAQRRAENKRVAERICTLTDGKDIVLAPFGVSRVVADRRCATVVATEVSYRGSVPTEAEDLLDLERLTYLANDLPQDRAAWFRQALEKRAVFIVALNKVAMANRRMRDVLRQIGFRKAVVSDSYTIYRRDAAR